jgi:hypothetical protein
MALNFALHIDAVQRIHDDPPGVSRSAARLSRLCRDSPDNIPSLLAPPLSPDSSKKAANVKKIRQTRLGNPLESAYFPQPLPLWPRQGREIVKHAEKR